ncbi:MAG: hypothetical protein HY397_01735 [Candidatus Doudnabacteria bacterium]|nr:hypothetical protein [Candidatus Doudnabacteria bacterium]
MQEIHLIFTRDFDQWVQEMVRNSLVKDCPKVWGTGFSDQIVHFNGQTFEWYRYKADMDRVSKFMVKKPLGDRIYSPKTQTGFLADVARLRRTLKSPQAVRRAEQEHLANLEKLFRKFYPYYPLGIFLPGAWKNDFLRYHGSSGKRVLKTLTHSREKSEGLLKEVGLHLRKWLGPKLVKYQSSREFVRLLSVAEIRKFVFEQKLPSQQVLKARSRGYVYFAGRILPTRNFVGFLKRKKIKVGNLENSPSGAHGVSGTVAYSGQGVTRGRAQRIFNSDQVSGFKNGRILVTPMTSPEYLPAMKIARAIVTDEGGVTSHAAIVARELKKPCLIGTRIATKFFRNGDLVEINWKSGSLKKL